MPRKPKTPQPLYKTKPGRAALLRRPNLKADPQVSPTTDDFVQATPLATAHFELKEDGSIGHLPFTEVARVIKTPPPRLTFADPDRALWLYHGNCLELLDAIAAKYPEGRFDAIFADPPYFLSNGGISCHAGKMVSVHKGDWDQSRGPELNHEFNTEWLRRCQRVLKPNGTIWVSGTLHVIHSIGYAMQQLGFRILNEITWEKPNPPPNLGCRCFTHSTETVLWAAKSEKSKHTFNYDLMRQTNGGKQMKTVWTMTAPTGDEKTFGKHPTQKPVALIERCLLASTNAGDLVLDPFLGGGTTAVAAVRLKRGCVGIELDELHANLAMKRIKSALEQNTHLFTPPPPDKISEDFYVIRFWLVACPPRNKRRGFELRRQFTLRRCEMKTGGFGGGNTRTGLDFEREVDFQDLLAAKVGYSVKPIKDKAGKGVFFHDKLVARCFRKHDFYLFLEEESVDWKPILSKKLLPDDALLVIVRETLFIIEVKYQQVEGSVDEKLQTCDFKRKQYLKLVTPLGLKVEYVYVLNDWFKDPRYKDVLAYIQSVNCHYKFGSLPLAWLGLPEPDDATKPASLTV